MATITEEAEAIITIDCIFRATARIVMMPKGHSDHAIAMLRKELATCEAHERTLIQAFIRYITVENT